MTGHVERNRETWDRRSAGYAEYARGAWARAEPAWGIWPLDLRALPDAAGRDVVELGCGAAYWRAEPRAPVGAVSRFPEVTAAWAQRWPSEEIWRPREN